MRRSDKLDNNRVEVNNTWVFMYLFLPFQYWLFIYYIAVHFWQQYSTCSHFWLFKVSPLIFLNLCKSKASKIHRICSNNSKLMVSNNIKWNKNKDKTKQLNERTDRTNTKPLKTNKQTKQNTYTKNKTHTQKTKNIKKQNKTKQTNTKEQKTKSEYMWQSCFIKTMVTSKINFYVNGYKTVLQNIWVTMKTTVDRQLLLMILDVSPM